MASKAFCIHGHFYQPPREDPLTAEIPLEPGAAPDRKWNERIHDQCYRPNAELGNFEKISFNIGPTLFQWMEDFDPQTVSRIVSEERHDVLAVPEESIVAGPDGATVLIMVEGEKAVPRPVKAGLRDGGLAEVEGEGLKEGQVIVTTDAYNITGETKIHIIENKQPR